jgi:hypothetical protein
VLVENLAGPHRAGGGRLTVTPGRAKLDVRLVFPLLGE